MSLQNELWFKSFQEAPETSGSKNLYWSPKEFRFYLWRKTWREIVSLPGLLSEFFKFFNWCERERERERETELFRLVMHLLVNSHMCPDWDGTHNHHLVYQDNTLTKWATKPELTEWIYCLLCSSLPLHFKVS